MVPSEVVAPFSPEELDEIVSGRRQIAISELKSATSYEDGFTASHPTVQLFWGVVSELPQRDVGRLLAFMTGSAAEPLFGARERLTIRRFGPEKINFTSSTCSRTVRVPACALPLGLSVRRRPDLTAG